MSKINPRKSQNTLKKQRKIQLKIKQSTKELGISRMRKQYFNEFFSSFYYRTARNDIDKIMNEKLLLCWKLCNSDFWNSLMALNSIFLQLLIIWEPENRKAEPLQGERFLYSLLMELSCLIILIFDLILNLLVNFQTRNKNISLGRQLCNYKKNVSKLSILIILVLDFVIHLVQHEQKVCSLRFGRFFRPFMIICYSKFLRRNLKGILQSISNLFVLFLLYFLVYTFFAFIGINLIGNLDGDIIIDKTVLDTGDFWQMFRLLFVLSTIDLYPTAMLPSLEYSKYYLIFFIPYILLFFVILIPIPMAIVYDGFKNYRLLIQQDDIIKQERSLLFCFTTLKEPDLSLIRVSQIQLMFHSLYRNRLDENEYEDLELIIGTKEKYLSFENFIKIFEEIQNDPQYSLDRLPAFEFWIKTIKYIEKKIRLKQKLESSLFAIIMFILVLINCIFIVASFFIEDVNVLYYFDVIDVIFFVIYIIEVLLKVFALGIYNYLEDPWNKFDFILVLLQLMFDFILINAITSNLSNTVKFNRILRLTKIQKVFRIFRAFRTVRIINVFLLGFKIFGKIQDIIYKIILCFPIAFKFSIITWIIFYLYAVLGVELFANNLIPETDSFWGKQDCSDRRYSRQQTLTEETADWQDCQYSSFDNFSSAILTLFQIFIQADWGVIMFDLISKLDSDFSIFLYFMSFMFFTIFLIALLSGLVWEIFNQFEVEEDIEEDESFNIFSQSAPKSIPFENNRPSLKLNQEEKSDSKIEYYNDDYKKIFEEENLRSLSDDVEMNWIQKDESSISKQKQKKNILVNLNKELKNPRQSLDQIEFYTKKINQHQQIGKFYKKLVEAIDLSKDTKMKEFQVQQIRQFCQNLQKNGSQLSRSNLENAFEEVDQKFALTGQLSQQILHNMQSLFRIAELEFLEFFQSILFLNNTLCRTLLPDQSFIQIIFEMENRWFYLKYVQKQIQFCKLGKGPWNHFKEIQRDSDKDESYCITPHSRTMSTLEQYSYEKFQKHLGQLRTSIYQDSYGSLILSNEQKILLMRAQNSKANQKIKSFAVVSVLYKKRSQQYSRQGAKQTLKSLEFQVIKKSYFQHERVDQQQAAFLVHEQFTILKQHKQILIKYLGDLIKFRDYISR